MVLNILKPTKFLCEIRKEKALLISFILLLIAQDIYGKLMINMEFRIPCIL